MEYPLLLRLMFVSVLAFDHGNTTIFHMSFVGSASPLMTTLHSQPYGNKRIILKICMYNVSKCLKESVSEHLVAYKQLLFTKLKPTTGPLTENLLQKMALEDEG